MVQKKLEKITQTSLSYVSRTHRKKLHKNERLFNKLAAKWGNWITSINALINYYFALMAWRKNGNWKTCNANQTSQPYVPFMHVRPFIWAHMPSEYMHECTVNAKIAMQKPRREMPRMKVSGNKRPVTNQNCRRKAIEFNIKLDETVFLATAIYLGIRGASHLSIIQWSLKILNEFMKNRQTIHGESAGRIAKQLIPLQKHSAFGRLWLCGAASERRNHCSSRIIQCWVFCCIDLRP